MLGYLRLFLVNYCLTREMVAVHRRYPPDAQKIIAVKYGLARHGTVSRAHDKRFFSVAVVAINQCQRNLSDDRPATTLSATDP